MDNLLAGIPGVIVYLDDILVTGENEQSHMQSEVLTRLSGARLRAKFVHGSICVIFRSQN